MTLDVRGTLPGRPGRYHQRLRDLVQLVLYVGASGLDLIRACRVAAAVVPCRWYELRPFVRGGSRERNVVLSLPPSAAAASRSSRGVQSHQLQTHLRGGWAREAGRLSLWNEETSIGTPKTSRRRPFRPHNSCRTLTFQ
jgi:hypothetical protein